MPRPVLGVLAAATVAACVSATAAYAVTPAPDCNGYAITDPNGDQFVGARLGDGFPHVAASPEIDIEGVFFHVDANGFAAHVQVADLPVTHSGKGASYAVRWHNPFGFGYQELLADRDATSVFYSYLTYDENGSWVSIRRAKGGALYPGEHGIVRIELPDDATYATSFGELTATTAANVAFYHPILGGDQLGTDRAEDPFYSHVTC